MFNAYELIYMVLQNDSYSYEKIYEEYKLLINKMVEETISNYPSLKIYREDFKQESYIVLMDSLCSYRNDLNASFKTFLYVCINRKLKTLIKHNLTEKNKSNINTLSLDGLVQEDSNNCSYNYFLNKDKLSEPDYSYRFKEAYKSFKNTYDYLSDDEKYIFNLNNCNVSYLKASNLLNMSVKKYDNNLQRIKRKIIDSVYDS